MNRSLALCLSLAISVFCLSALADEATDQFKTLMKPAAAANGAMQKSIQADLAAAAGSAAEVQAKFHGIEQFWTKRGAQDAQTFARNIQGAAAKVEAAAKAGNKEEAMTAAKQIGANCMGCHAAHREKAADGSWALK